MRGATAWRNLLRCPEIASKEVSHVGSTIDGTRSRILRRRVFASRNLYRHPVSACGSADTCLVQRALAVNESATFKTQALQSQFGSQTQVTIGGNQFLGFEFDTGEVRFGQIEETIIGDFGGAATIDVSGKFGLETSDEFSSTNLDISLPHSVPLEFSSSSVSNPTLTPLFRVGRGADNFFQTEFPSLPFGSALMAELDPSVKIDACLFGCFLSGQEIIPSGFRGIDAKLPLLGYESVTNTFSVFGQTIDFHSNSTLTFDLSRPVLVNGQVVSSLEVDPRVGTPLNILVDREAEVTPVFNLAPQVTIFAA